MSSESLTKSTISKISISTIHENLSSKNKSEGVKLNWKKTLVAFDDKELFKQFEEVSKEEQIQFYNEYKKHLKVLKTKDCKIGIIQRIIDYIVNCFNGLKGFSKFQKTKMIAHELKTILRKDKEAYLNAVFELTKNDPQLFKKELKKNIKEIRNNIEVQKTILSQAHKVGSKFFNEVVEFFVKDKIMGTKENILANFSSWKQMALKEFEEAFFNTLNIDQIKVFIKANEKHAFKSNLSNVLEAILETTTETFYDSTNTDWLNNTIYLDSENGIFREQEDHKKLQVLQNITIFFNKLLDIYFETPPDSKLLAEGSDFDKKFGYIREYKDHNKQHLLLTIKGKVLRAIVAKKLIEDFKLETKNIADYDKQKKYIQEKKELFRANEKMEVYHSKDKKELIVQKMPYAAAMEWIDKINSLNEAEKKCFFTIEIGLSRITEHPRKNDIIDVMIRNSKQSYYVLFLQVLYDTAFVKLEKMKEKECKNESLSDEDKNFQIIFSKFIEEMKQYTPLHEVPSLLVLSLKGCFEHFDVKLFLKNLLQKPTTAREKINSYFFEMEERASKKGNPTKSHNRDDEMYFSDATDFFATEDFANLDALSKLDLMRSLKKRTKRRLKTELNFSLFKRMGHVLNNGLFRWRGFNTNANIAKTLYDQLASSIQLLENFESDEKQDKYLEELYAALARSEQGDVQIDENLRSLFKNTKIFKNHPNPYQRIAHILNQVYDQDAKHLIFKEVLDGLKANKQFKDLQSFYEKTKQNIEREDVKSEFMKSFGKKVAVITD